MRLKSRWCAVLGIAVGVCHMTIVIVNEVHASWAISTPVANQTYTPTSNISSHGDMDIGEDLMLRVLTPEPTRATAAEKYIDSPPMGVEWEWDFPAPENGWSPVANGWQFRLIEDDTGTTKDHHAFNIGSI